MPPTFNGIRAQVGPCSAPVESVNLVGLIYKVDVRLPSAIQPCLTTYSAISRVNPLFLSLNYNDNPVMPLLVTSLAVTGLAAVQSRPMPVWVSTQ